MAAAKIKIKPLYILLSLIPAWVLVGLQAFVPTGNFAAGSFFLGTLVGASFAVVLYCFAPALLRQAAPVKVAALLVPALLITGCFWLGGRTTLFWALVLLAFWVMAWFAFVLPMENREARAASTLMMLAFGVAAGYCLLAPTGFSPDSWSYLEMSDVIFTKPFQVNTIRQYLRFTSYGHSFPYLYPLALAVVRFFTGLDIYAGVLVNLLAAAGSCALLYRLSQHLANSPVPGGIAAVFLMGSRQYLDELNSARAIPLAIMFLLLTFCLLCRLPKTKNWQVFLAGAAAGAGTVTRFDAMVVFGCAFLCVLIFAGKDRFKKAALFLVGGFLLLLPWMIYSLAVFQKPWISDNNGTFLLLGTYIPTRYFSQQYVPQSIFTGFATWLRVLFTMKLGTVVSSFFRCFIQNGGVFILLWAGMALAMGEKGRRLSSVWEDKHLRGVFGAVVFTYLLKSALLVLVGYGDPRYHLETWAVLILLLCALLYRPHVQRPRTGTAMRFASLAVGLLLAVQAGAITGQRAGAAPKYLPIQESVILRQDEKIEAIRAAVTQEEQPRVLFMGGVLAYQFGVYTGLPTFDQPVVQTDDPTAFDEVVQEYIRPDYIVAEQPLDPAVLHRYGLLAVLETPGYTVFQVTAKPW